MRQPIATPDAPAAIGPYSQAVRHGNLLWISGQIGLDPAGGGLAGDDTASQARQVLRNLQAVCAAAGTSLQQAVMCTVYLVDLGEFALVNGIYEQAFAAPFPARATVQAAALPRGARVEISAVVALP